MSMKPGVTAQPDASSSRAASPRFVPIALITPSVIATSATRPGAPVPSNTVPPRTTISAAITVLRIHHELEQVAVGIAHVDARRRPAARTLARDRPFLDRGADPVEPRLQRLRGAVPDEAQVATRWNRGRCAQCEAGAAPHLRPMEVDHLVARVHR